MISKSKKKNLGQFFTKNYNYILESLWADQISGMIVEPFAGDGHLLDFIRRNGFTGQVRTYDIDQRHRPGLGQ